MRKSALLALGLVVTALVALGLVILSSASEANAMRLHHGDALFFMKRQSLYLVVGIAIAATLAKIDYHVFRRYPLLVWLGFAIVVALMVAVLAFPPIKGSRRWIPLGIMNLQPSELAKLMVVMVTATWLDKIAWRVELFWRGAVCSGLFVGVLVALAVCEPDFGAAMVIGLAGALVMIVAGVRFWRHMVPLGLLGGAAVLPILMTNANRMARMSAFFGFKIDVGVEVLDKAADNAAYQGHQALVAIMNGGLWGVGLNKSMQKHYYLPEAHTDMIFPIGAEELGLVFSIGTVLLFCAFFALSVYIAAKAADRFGRFLALGMSFIIFYQAMFNIGVVCEALPMKGMALPFFSYGGTNMLSAFTAVGMILSVGIHSLRDPQRMFARRKVNVRVRSHG